MVDNKFKKLKTLLDYVVLPFFCIITSIYVVFGNNREEYNLMFLLPIAFFFCYELFLKNSFRDFKIFSVSYTIVSFIRFVIMPLLIVLGGRYDGRSSVSPSDNSFVLAFILMIMELLVCSILIWFLSRKLKHNNSQKRERIVFPKQWTIYILFVAISLALAVVRPETLRSFSFITPNENLLNYDDFDIISQMIILCLSVSKNILTLMILTYFYKNYITSGHRFWVLSSFSLIALNSAVYFGTNRFDFVLNLIASTIVFCMLYRKYWKVTVLIMALLGFIGFISITQARDLRGATDKNNMFYQMADVTQMYFGGPYNVAIAIETAEAYPEGRTLKTAFYDCTRSVLGLNVIVRNVKDVELSSHYYNRRIFNSSHSTQIIPMIGEGYYLFGILFAPIFDIMFVLLAYLLTKQKNKVSIEIWYFFALSLVRLGFINCQSATIQLNDLSFNLFMPLILYFINNLFQRTSDKKERGI